jgi:hypothetical protein
MVRSGASMIEGAAWCCIDGKSLEELIFTMQSSRLQPIARRHFVSLVKQPRQSSQELEADMKLKLGPRAPRDSRLERPEATASGA